MGEVKGDMDGLGLFQKPPVREFLEVVRLAVKDNVSIEEGRMTSSTTING